MRAQDKIKALRAQSAELLKQAAKIEEESHSDYHFSVSDLVTLRKLSDAMLVGLEHSSRKPELAKAIDTVVDLVIHLSSGKSLESWARAYSSSWGAR